MYLVSLAYSRCCRAHQCVLWQPHITQRPLNLSISWYYGTPMLYLKLCYASRSCVGSLQCCLPLLTHRFMPRFPTISKAEGGAGTLLCPCICSANMKESRDKGKEISSISSRATLIHSYLPFLKKLLPKPYCLRFTEFGLFF